MTLIEDAELLRRYAEHREERAFAELVRRHIDRVYAVACRQVGGDAQLAEDVSQRVFADLARKAAELSQRAVIGGWLYRSTQFAATDVVRAERRRKVRETEAATMSDDALIEGGARRNGGPGGSDTQVNWENVRPVLDQAMRELSDDDRDAVWLRYFEGRSFAEVGARLRLAENAARMRVERALDKLHGTLAKRGVTSTTAALGVALGNQAIAASAPAGLAAMVTGAALASVKASAGSAVIFMSTAKMVNGVVVALAVAAIGFGWRERGRAEAAENAVVAMTMARDHTMAQLRDAENRKETKAPGPVVARATETKRSEVATAGAPDHAADSREIDEAALDRLVAATPELQQLYVRQQTVRIRSKYGPFYRSAGLSAEQIGKFEQAMADHAQTSIDVPAVALAQGLGKDDPAVAALMRQANETKAVALREALGEAGYEAWRQYDQTKSLRNVATDLAGELFYSASPLTGSQADQLTKIVFDSMGEQRGPVNWDFIVREAKAQGVLSPAQLAILAEKKEQIELGQRIYAMTQVVRSKGKGAVDTRTGKP